MRKWLLCVIGCLLLLLAACDEVPSETVTNGTPQNEAVLRPPTRTVKPIVSFTPRFTATPIPSATYTPSITPTPTTTDVPATQTLTPTLTLTPTIGGVIQSNENVNLRSGPGLDNDIVASVLPGTELGVLNLLIDEKGVKWYEVAYEDETGTVERLWVSASLVRTDFEERINRPPLSAEEATAAATREPTPTPEPNRVEILAYCQQKGIRPPSPTTEDNIYIEWSWFVAREDYMPEHLENANYEIRLDDKLLENWSQYATDIKREAGRWIVYWYYPVGKLSPGEHEITFRLTWDKTISDGYAQFGPDTANEVDTGNCSFTVAEP